MISPCKRLGGRGWILIAGQVGTALGAGVPTGHAAEIAWRSALTFHASFDAGTEADYARGDRQLYHAPAMNKRAEAIVGLPPDSTVARRPRQGKFGGALQFRQKSDATAFYQSARNLPYQATNWSGSVSFWLSTDPATDLAPGYCDPLQITPRAWNDAAFFVEFEKRPGSIPFRLGAYADFKVWNPGNRKWESIPAAEKPLVAVDRPPFEPGQWTHVVFTFDRYNTGKPDGITRLYLNGLPAGTLPTSQQTFTWDPAKAHVMLGLGYVGWLDELSLFDRALSEPEVAALHGLPAGVTPFLKDRFP